jgi:hypothetical protein
MHVGYSVVEIVAAIDCINWHGWRWVSQIGDVDVPWEDSGCQGIILVEAVAKAMVTVNPQAKAYQAASSS